MSAVERVFGSAAFGRMHARQAILGVFIAKCAPGAVERSRAYAAWPQWPQVGAPEVERPERRAVVK